MTTEFETQIEEVLHQMGRGNVPAAIKSLVSALKIVEARPAG